MEIFTTEEQRLLRREAAINDILLELAHIAYCLGVSATFSKTGSVQPTVVSKEVVEHLAGHLAEYNMAVSEELDAERKQLE